MEIFIENEEGNTFMFECPKKITYAELKKLIESKGFTNLRRFYHIVFKGAVYENEHLNDIMKIEEGDRITIVNDRENEGGVFAEFHKNINLTEGDINNIIPLTGILRLILIKYISSYITDVSKFSPEIEKIIRELKKGMKLDKGAQKDIKSNLEETEGHNILAYSNYVSSVIKDDKIDFMLKQLPPNKVNEIKKYWSILSIYEEFNKKFEVELYKALERSYIAFSLVALSIYEQTNRKQYIYGMNHCPNAEVRNLFHGSQIDPISNIITNGFLYTRKAFYGMGIYFTDMLDYASFYAGGKDYKTRRMNFKKILPVNETFSCVSAEVYYSKNKKIDIYDFSLRVPDLDHFPSYEEIKSNWENKMVEKNGLHFARVEPNQGQVRKREDIIKDTKKGAFLGTEYVITELKQILPLYGLTFKRNEYLIIWRDPHFEGSSMFYEFLEEQKLFIYEYAKMNAYFESSIEKALELIQRKKYNKIILISNIGLDLSGKRFVEIARKILGFNVMVLFYSKNKSHLSWLQNFPNVLFTDNSNFYQEYILNYNESGLLNLKKKIETYYNIKLIFDNNFLIFPKFISSEEFDNIIFGEQIQYFKKVVIKHSNTNSILCIDDKKNICLIEQDNVDINLNIWYVTIIENEITLFCNGYYLGTNVDLKTITCKKYMEKFKFEIINNNNYLFYYDNKENILTIDENRNLIIEKEKSDRTNQKFKLIELMWEEY